MKRSELQSLSPEQQGLLQALMGDGRPLLIFTGLSLILSGGFALFLAATGQFLPHDTQFLGMSIEQLCAVQNCPDCAVYDPRSDSFRGSFNCDWLALLLVG
jgi:hypothetical protein